MRAMYCATAAFSSNGSWSERDKERRQVSFDELSQQDEEGATNCKSTGTFGSTAGEWSEKSSATHSS